MPAERGIPIKFGRALRFADEPGEILQHSKFHGPPLLQQSIFCELAATPFVSNGILCYGGQSVTPNRDAGHI